MRYVLTFLLLVAVACAQPTQWESRGVSGGGANFSPAVSPFDSKQLFLSSDVAGLFHTGNQGETWANLDYRQIRGNTRSEVQFTADPNVLYAIDYGKSAAAPARSDDAGQTWRQLTDLPEPEEAYGVYADPLRTDRFLVNYYAALYLTKDAGKSYELLYRHDDMNTGLHVAGVFWDGGMIFVGTNAGLFQGTGPADFAKMSMTGVPDDEGFRSFAGGRNSKGVARLFAITYPKAQLFAGLWGNDYEAFAAAYVGTTEGAWTNVSQNFGPSFKPTFVDLAHNQSDVAYLAGGDNVTGRPLVLKTDDGGDTWRYMLRSEKNENTNVGWCGDGGGFRWYWGGNALGFAASPTDPNVAFLTNWGFAELTTDGGATWNSLYVRPEERTPKGQLLNLNERYRSNGLDVTGPWDICWADSLNMVIGFTDIQGIHSQDGGQSWGLYDGYQNVTLNTQYNIVKHNGKLYASSSAAHDLYQTWWLQDSQIDGKTGRVLVSEDKGLSWRVLHDFGNPCAYITFGPGNRLYAMVASSTQGGVYVCDDIEQTPDTWRALAKPPRTEGRAYRLRVLDDGALVATYSGRRLNNKFSQSSGVFTSTDGGQTWADRSDPMMLYYTKDVVIDPYDPAQNTWYVGVFSGWGGAGNNMGGLYRTTDRGLNWSRLVSDTTSLFVESCTFQSADKLYVTTDGQGLLYSENARDAAPTFRIVESFPFPKTNYVYFNPYDPNEVWVLTYGNGVKVGRLEPSGRAAVEAPAVRVYPNPAADVMRIDGAGVFTLSDVTGRVVLRRAVNREEVSLEGLAPGVYAWRLGDVAGKLVVVR